MVIVQQFIWRRKVSLGSAGPLAHKSGADHSDGKNHRDNNKYTTQNMKAQNHVKCHGDDITVWLE